MQIDIKFINNFQEDIFTEQKRNICASGGFGNGKTTVCCHRTEPPVSEPEARGTRPLATAQTEPLLEPPDTRSGKCG